MFTMCNRCICYLCNVTFYVTYTYILLMQTGIYYEKNGAEKSIRKSSRMDVRDKMRATGNVLITKSEVSTPAATKSELSLPVRK